jgi:hypothetical protein
MLSINGCVFEILLQDDATIVVLFCYFLFYVFATMALSICYDIFDESLQQSRFCYGNTDDISGEVVFLLH